MTIRSGACAAPSRWAHAWCAAQGAVRLVVLKDELAAVLSGGDN